MSEIFVEEDKDDPKKTIEDVILEKIGVKHHYVKKGRKELLASSEVSLILDTYDDIFSDFDPRPYTHRALSDDFLLEAKRATREISPEVLELHFLMPKQMRKFKEEALIKKRLRDHFKKHTLRLEGEAKNAIRQAALSVFFGIILMLIATYIVFKNPTSFVFYFLVTILEPAGWFTFWYGLDQTFMTIKEIKPEIDFYDKMTKSIISFESY